MSFFIDKKCIASHHEGVPRSTDYQIRIEIMTTKNTTILTVATLTVVSLFSIGVVNAFAAEEAYLYVDTSGAISSEIAENPSEAIVDANNIKTHSGVILASSYYALAGESTVTYTGTGGANLYAYIAADGSMRYVTANSTQEALATAPNIALHSGVQIVVE